MKIIHTSDWHIGRMLFEYQLLGEQAFIFEQLYSLIKSEKPDAVIIAGDLYNRSIPATDSVKLLDTVLFHIVDELSTPVLCIAGNHDSGERLSFASRLYEKRGLYIEGEISQEIRKVTLSDKYGDVDFWLLPYITPTDMRPIFPDEEVRTYDDAYRVILEKNAHRLDSTKRNVLIAHGFFSPISEDKNLSIITSDSEVSLGGADIVSTSYLKAFDYVALGHLHAPQKLGCEHIRYSGSPLKYSLSESSQRKAFTVVELSEKENITIHEIPIKPLRDVRIIKGSFDELIKPVSNELCEDYIFAELSDNKVILHAMEKLRVLYPNMLGLKFSELGGNENIASIGGNKIKETPISTLFWEFLETVSGTKIDDENDKIMSQIFAEVLKENS